MHRHSLNAFCCGGGGGNFFTDILGTVRTAPAASAFGKPWRREPGSLPWTCPTCAKMLTDAVKLEGMDEKLEVLNIAEILERALAK
jgi:Fe-S oxidoreductase